MIYRGCNQRWPEFHAWTCLVGGLRAKSYIELGCGSAHFLREVGVERIVTVDILPNGLGSHMGLPTPHYQGDSQASVTRDAVLSKLGCDPDVVFIDADHSAAAVQADFNLWYPVARLAVGFHDILMPGVADAWASLRRRYPSIELISRDIASANAWQHTSDSSGDVNCGGIGVIFKGEM